MQVIKYKLYITLGLQVLARQQSTVEERFLLCTSSRHSAGVYQPLRNHRQGIGIDTQLGYINLLGTIDKVQVYILHSRGISTSQEPQTRYRYRYIAWVYQPLRHHRQGIGIDTQLGYINLLGTIDKVQVQILSLDIYQPLRNHRQGIGIDIQLGYINLLVTIDKVQVQILRLDIHQPLRNHRQGIGIATQLGYIKLSTSQAPQTSYRYRNPAKYMNYLGSLDKIYS